MLTKKLSLDNQQLTRLPLQEQKQLMLSQLTSSDQSFHPMLAASQLQTSI
jgi:hypothetical protein